MTKRSGEVQVAIQQAMHGIANDLVNALVEKLDKNGSVDTGFLKNSITVKIKGKTIVVEMAGYGKHVEFGTNPHIIKPKGKALKFKKDGKDIFAKQVKHPGTRPKPFIRPVVHQQLQSIIKRNLQKHVQ